MWLTASVLREEAAAQVRRLAGRLGWPGPLLWAALTLLFLYERTYLIQKAGLPHFVACVGVRLGLLLALCYAHNGGLVPHLLAGRRYGRYSLLLLLLTGSYLLLQGAYDQYLFGYVIGDQERAGLWQNLPYNALAAGWYVLLTYLVARRTASPLPAAAIPASRPAAAEVTELVVRTEGEWRRLTVADIWYAQGLKDYTILHTAQGSVTVKGSLGKVAQELPAGQFLRVHKSYLVARQHIQAVSGSEVRLTGQTVPIGRAYAAALNGFKAGELS